MYNVRPMDIINFLINYILHLNDNLALLVSQYGTLVYVILFLIIFCEMGLVIAAVMPGDSLLFAAGSIAATSELNVYVLMLLLIIAAFSGYLLNYWIGNKVGHLLFKNENSRIFKKSYLDKTHRFYARHGGRTILVSCFIPIIRTFAPFVAGMSDMQHRKFVMFNFIGTCVWVVVLVYGSFLFGNISFVKNNFSMVILAIIFISILPPVFEYIRHKRGKQ
jgi:membrane-associated protein